MATIAFPTRVQTGRRRHATRLASLLLLVLVIGACEKKSSPPSPQPGNGNGGGETITGRERIGWDQPAASAEELGTFRYAIYVDGTRNELTDVSCANTGASGTFACSAKLPTMTAGTHTLELAAFVVAGQILESGRSATLRVTVQASTTGLPAPVQWTSGPGVVTRDGVSLALEHLADGISNPVDLAVATDGRVFVAQRSGEIVVLTPGETQLRSNSIDVDGGEVVAMALGRQFERTHLLYVLYAAPSPAGRTYRVLRLREVQGVLGERAVLLNSLAPASEPTAASLRVAGDGRLLIALGNTAAEPALSGKLLRFEADGTTPEEQRGSPAVVAGLEQPLSSAWDAQRSTLWTLDGRSGQPTLTPITFAPGRVPAPGITYAVPGRAVSSVTVHDGAVVSDFRHNLLLASGEGGYILRLRPSAGDRSRELASERLLDGRVGPILLVATGADGAIYFSTQDAIGRLVPQQ